MMFSNITNISNYLIKFIYYFFYYFCNFYYNKLLLFLNLTDQKNYKMMNSMNWKW